MEFNKRYRGGSLPPAQQTPQQSSQTNNPWAPTQPYIEKSYEMAANQYAQGPAQYTPWSQVANLTPDQQAHINGVNQYVNALETQQMVRNQLNAVQNLMTGANNPYNNITAQTNPMLAGFLQNNRLNDTAQGINRFLYQNVGDQALQQSISNGVDQTDAALGGIRNLIQNGSGFGQNIATNNAGNFRANAVNSALGAGFDMQNANRMKAIEIANGINNNKASMAANMLETAGDYSNKSQNLGYSQYTNALNSPLGLLQELNKVGGINQDYAQALLGDATNRWNFNQQAPYDALAKYAAVINPDKSWGNTYTNNSGAQQGAGVSNAALGIGAGTSLAGLTAAANSKK